MNPVSPSVAVRDFLGVPFKRGGRDRSGWDCLGVVLAVVRALGHDVDDPWRRLEAEWRERKLEAATGLPAGWVRVDLEVAGCDGDVLLYESTGATVHVGVLLSGYEVSAELEHGTYARAWSPHAEPRPSQVWRAAA